MNYKFELKGQGSSSNIVFNTIVFDSFKINIIERYAGRPNALKLSHVLFKVRTLDDQLINRKDGNIRVKIKDENLEKYKELIKRLYSYDYKNKLINRKEADQDYVYFILDLVIRNYQLN
ncbi:prevent-host-death protein [uncultured Chryseobacterium sp.]|uniref:prevent-host-death protein n=1 Tax=uncultured Chryseobacterium sp. TaxID=259322 RepID=UPI0025E37764|nr:prevent-host-death protein [uncultured Chryseobacterium sp.]